MSNNIYEDAPRWDLSDLYSSFSSTEFKFDVELMESKINGFSEKYEGIITNLEAGQLHTAIVEYESINDLVTKIASYAYLFYSTNLDKPEALSFFQNNSEVINRVSTKLLFFSLELNEIPEDSLSKAFELSEISYYKPWLDKIRALKPYQLSKEEEKILNEKSITSSDYWMKLFDVTMAAMRFPYNGEELTYSNIAKKAVDAEEAVRKEANLSICNTLKKNINLFSLITNALVKDKAIEDSLRHLPTITTFRNLSNQVEDEVVESLVSTVKANYANLAERYYLLKAKWMGKDQLDFWDRNAPLPEAPEECVPWDEAKRIVLESYEKFSPQFSEIAQQFFDNRWIDAGVYEGKDYGAYSHPTATSVHPYIMMNYQCKKQDIMTLAHELGHGVHQFMARENGALMAGTPLTLAETASIFGEQLVFKHLIENETDPKALKIMISKKVEDSLNTIVRQITFHEFEFRVHTERKQGELSPQRINDIWLEVNRECFGLSMKYPDDASVLWSSIPHFIHSPFYVYSYAFGNCLVNSLYAVYESGSVEDFVPKYIDMLKAGGTKKHKEMLAPFGLDASNPSFWQGGLDIISHMIDELAKLD